MFTRSRATGEKAKKAERSRETPILPPREKRQKNRSVALAEWMKIFANLKASGEGKRHLLSIRETAVKGLESMGRGSTTKGLSWKYPVMEAQLLKKLFIPMKYWSSQRKSSLTLRE